MTESTVAASLPSSSNGRPLLRILVEGSVVLASTTWIFLCGLFYIHGCYKPFGLDVQTLELPIYYLALGAIVPVGKAIALFSIPFVLFLVPRLIREYAPKSWQKVSSPLSSPFPDWLTRIFLGLIVFLLLLIVISLADREGRKTGEGWKAKPTARINLVFRKDEAQLFDPAMVKANSNGSLMLLVQTKDLIVMFVKDENGHAKPGVFIVPRANLLSVHN